MCHTFPPGCAEAKDLFCVAPCLCVSRDSVEGEERGRGTYLLQLPRPLLHDPFAGRGRGRVARIACAERGAGGRACRSGGACSPPNHISVCAQPFTPTRSTWRTPHTQTMAGGTWANGEGGWGGTQGGVAQDRRKGGAHANTVCGAPPSLFRCAGNVNENVPTSCNSRNLKGKIECSLLYGPKK